MIDRLGSYMIGSTFLKLLPTAHLHLRRDLSPETSKNTYPVITHIYIYISWLAWALERNTWQKHLASVSIKSSSSSTTASQKPCRSRETADNSTVPGEPNWTCRNSESWTMGIWFQSWLHDILIVIPQTIQTILSGTQVFTYQYMNGEVISIPFSECWK